MDFSPTSQFRGVTKHLPAVQNPTEVFRALGWAARVRIKADSGRYYECIAPRRRGDGAEGLAVVVVVVVVFLAIIKVVVIIVFHGGTLVRLFGCDFLLLVLVGILAIRGS